MGSERTDLDAKPHEQGRPQREIGGMCSSNTDPGTQHPQVIGASSLFTSEIEKQKKYILRVAANCAHHASDARFQSYLGVFREKFFYNVATGGIILYSWSAWF